MASEIRVNSLTNRSGLSTVSITDAGAVIAGMVTATSFSGPLTGDVTGNITATNGTFSGNLSVGGVLTYDDVTNIDSVGVITARSGIHITSGSLGIGTDNPNKALVIQHTVGRRHQFSFDDSILTIKGSNHNENPESIRLIGDSIRFNTGISGSGTEKLRITADGKVGIGTDTPGAVLEVFDATSNTIVNVKSGDSGAVLNLIDDSARSSIEQNGTTLKISSDTGAEVANSDIRLQVDGSTKMLVNSSGNIGINQTSPSEKLEVYAGDILLSGNANGVSGGVGPDAALKFEYNGHQYAKIVGNGRDSSGYGDIDFYTSTSAGVTNLTQKMTIRADGRVGINRITPSFMLDIIGNSSTGANCIRIVDGAETGHGSHPAKIVAGGTYYHEMQMHSRRFTVHTWNGSNIAERFRVHQDGTVTTGGLSSTPGTVAAGSFVQAAANAGFFSNGIDGKFGTASSHPLYLQVNGVTKATVTTGGAFSVGTTSPQQPNVPSMHLHSTANDDARIAITTPSKPNSRIGYFGLSNKFGMDVHNGFEVRDASASYATRLAIDSVGRVTTPAQPSFKAKLNTATGANFSGTLVFNNVSFNVGSHYNSSNGRFTAPVDGKYLFCWYDNIEVSGSNAIYVDWLINGNAQGNRIYSYENGGWQGLAGSIIFDLNTNDYVQIFAYSSGNYDGGLYGSFSGCLLG